MVSQRGKLAGMVTVGDVSRMALELPEAVEGERHGTLTWAVGGKTFAWERPFSKADIKRFGAATPPEGPILAVRVEDLGEKEAVLAVLRCPYPAEAGHQDGRETSPDRWLAGLRATQAGGTISQALSSPLSIKRCAANRALRVGSVLDVGDEKTDPARGGLGQPAGQLACLR